jgi:hypothetical protein
MDRYIQEHKAPHCNYLRWRVETVRGADDAGVAPAVELV